MVAATYLTLSAFQLEYEKGDRTYEYWHGRAVPKGMPTWIHGILQSLIMRLLEDAGYVAGSEVELRIVADARPKPDVIATRGRVEIPYPTNGVDVVVEILSADDLMGYTIEKFRSYKEWGFKNIYVVDAEARLVFCWTGQGLAIADTLTSIPVADIWALLDKALQRSLS